MNSRIGILSPIRHIMLKVRKSSVFETITFENVEIIYGDAKKISENASVLHYCVPQYFDDFRAHDLESSISKEYIYSGNFFEIIGSTNIIRYKSNYIIANNLKLDRKNCGFGDNSIRFHHKNYLLVRLPKRNVTASINRGIYLSGSATYNYYHFLFEFISRFQKINSLDIDRNIPLIMDEICLKIYQFKELVDTFNIHKHPIFYVQPYKNYIVKELYYFPPPNFIPPHFINISIINGSDCMFNLDSLNFIRTKLKSKMAKGDYPSRIFLSRKNASARRAFNEEEVERLFASFGFSVVYPEQHTVAEQVGLFYNAEMIAGGSGAAFANIVFCNANCKIFCFINYKYPGSLFSSIAKYIGAEMIYIYDKEKKLNDSSKLHDPFHIDIDNLRKFVKTYM